MKLSRVAVIFLALAVGCAHEPFVREPLPELKNPDPGAIREIFALSSPNHFISDDTVIIDAPFNHDFAFLGVLQVNRSNGEFIFVALNQVGLKLFQLGGHGKTVEVQYALGPLQDHKDILQSFGQDIRNMYFDLVPSESAEASAGETEVRFTQETSDGTVEYAFGGYPTVLLQKRLRGFFGDVWRAQYYEYSLQDGTLYPRGIVMDNSAFHYRIIVKNRDREIR